MADSKVLNAQALKAQQANAKLQKTIEELAKHVTSLSEAAVAQATINEAIATKEAELSALDVQFNEERRQREVAFDLELKANQLAKVTEVLNTQGKTVIASDELTRLRNEYDALNRQFNEKLNTEIAVIKQSAEASKAAAIRQKELELKAESAAVSAQITSLQEKNTLLGKQVEDYKAQINAEREARVKEAQARGNPVVTVASSK